MKCSCLVARAGIVTAVVAPLMLGPACFAPPVVSPPPPPPPQYNPVVNTMEYQAETAVYNNFLDRFDDMQFGTNDAFGSAAAITFTWSVTNTVLQAPVNGWPNPDPNDQQYYDPNNGTFYRSFVALNRTTAFQFGTFYLSGTLHSIPICTGGRVLGITTPNVENDPTYTYNYETGFPGPAYRGSFIFTQDVDDWATQCTSYPAQNVQIHVLTHEVGHQRAGLTHTDRHVEFHNGQGYTVVPPRYDVMYSDANNSDLSFRPAIFDYVPGGPSTTYSERTCQDNLFHWRSF